MRRHRLVAIACLVVVLAALALAVTVTAWALVAVPPALVVGVAAWRGVGPGTVLQVVSENDDPGAGPAGMVP